ncbi:KH domain-containing protein [Nymphaea thermarum]|nr:KH domain-containing protein [Nymphaea thermarum]
MSFALTPSKRPYEWNHIQPNGREKWNNFPLPSQHQRKLPSDSIVFRILCRASKTGSVIGKGGTIVTQIRKETGAKIRVEEPLPGCEERVVVIIGPEKDKEADKEQSREDGDENEGGDNGKEIKEQEDEKDDKESEPLKDQHGEKGIPPAQKALLLVFERMVEGESDETEDEASKKSSFVVRLLVPSIQVGCILGKGGSVIKQMSAESGAQIRILPRDKIPSCALPSEELVQISGPVDSARKALQSVSQQLLENPPRERDTFPAGKSSFLATHPLGPVPHSEGPPPIGYHSSAQGPRHAFGLHDGNDFFPSASPSVSMFHDPARSSRVNSPPDILSFRLLCTNEKVGGVIGKGGSIVRNIHSETGADIKILDAVQDTDDRVIAISAPVHPMDRIAAAQDALLRVQHRVVRSVPDSSDKNVLARLLVPSNQIGCLLGKGGSIMAEMRKLSGAQIRILGKDQISKCASEHEEEVQVFFFCSSFDLFPWYLGNLSQYRRLFYKLPQGCAIICFVVLLCTIHHIILSLSTCLQWCHTWEGESHHLKECIPALVPRRVNLTRVRSLHLTRNNLSSLTVSSQGCPMVLKGCPCPPGHHMHFLLIMYLSNSGTSSGKSLLIVLLRKLDMFQNATVSNVSWGAFIFAEVECGD